MLFGSYDVKIYLASANYVYVCIYTRYIRSPSSRTLGTVENSSTNLRGWYTRTLRNFVGPIYFFILPPFFPLSSFDRIRASTIEIHANPEGFAALSGPALVKELVLLGPPLLFFIFFCFFFCNSMLSVRVPGLTTPVEFDVSLCQS